jgi:hypothetical protein
MLLDTGIFSGSSFSGNPHNTGLLTFVPPPRVQVACGPQNPAAPCGRTSDAAGPLPTPDTVGTASHSVDIIQTGWYLLRGFRVRLLSSPTHSMPPSRVRRVSLAHSVSSQLSSRRSIATANCSRSSVAATPSGPPHSPASTWRAGSNSCQQHPRLRRAERLANRWSLACTRPSGPRTLQ